MIEIAKKKGPNPIEAISEKNNDQTWDRLEKP